MLPTHAQLRMHLAATLNDKARQGHDTVGLTEEFLQASVAEPADPLAE